MRSNMCEDASAQRRRDIASWMANRGDDCLVAFELTDEGFKKLEERAIKLHFLPKHASNGQWIQSLLAPRTSRGQRLPLYSDDLPTDPKRLDKMRKKRLQKECNQLRLTLVRRTPGTLGGQIELVSSREDPEAQLENLQGLKQKKERELEDKQEELAALEGQPDPWCPRSDLPPSKLGGI